MSPVLDRLSHPFFRYQNMCHQTHYWTAGSAVRMLLDLVELNSALHLPLLASRRTSSSLRGPSSAPQSSSAPRPSVRLRVPLHVKAGRVGLLSEIRSRAHQPSSATQRSSRASVGRIRHRSLGYRSRATSTPLADAGGPPAPDVGHVPRLRHLPF